MNSLRIRCQLYLYNIIIKGWGNLDDEDKKTNEEALKYPDDLCVMGAYDTSKGKIWIITNRISEKEEGKERKETGQLN